MKVIKTAFFWVYNVRFLALKNRIFSLSFKEILQFIIVFLVGIFLLYFYVIIPQVQNADKLLFISRNRLMWACIIFPFLKLLTTTKSVSLPYEDGVIISITDKKLHTWLIFNFIKNNCSIIFILLISISVACILHLGEAFIIAFVGLWTYRYIVNCLCFIYKILKFQYTNTLSLALNSLLITLIIVFVHNFIIDANLPPFVQDVLEPIFSSLSILFNDAHELNLNLVILFFYFVVCILLSYILVKKVLDISGQLEYRENEAYSNQTISLNLNINTHSLLVYNEMILFIKNILTIKGLVQILLPSFIYILLSLYIVYSSEYQTQIETDLISITMVPIFAVIGFPVLYIIPYLHNEKEYQWIYKLYIKSSKKMMLLKLISTSIYGILSIMLSSFIVYVLCILIFGINYYSLLHIPTFVWMSMLSPIMASSLGILFNSYLPDAYFNPNSSQMNFISMVTLIWFESIVYIPIIIFLFKGMTEHIYILYYILYCLFITYLSFKIAIYYFRIKEI